MHLNLDVVGDGYGKQKGRGNHAVQKSSIRELSFDDEVLGYACSALSKKADRIIVEKTLRDIFDELDLKPSEVTMDDIDKSIEDITVKYQANEL